jgi:hypothetical protein
LKYFFPSITIGIAYGKAMGGLIDVWGKPSLTNKMWTAKHLTFDNRGRANCRCVKRSAKKGGHAAISARIAISRSAVMYNPSESKL